VLFVLVATLSFGLPPSGAELAAPTVDVNRVASVVLVGEHGWDLTGRRVAAAGDVNGDRIPDAVVPAMRVRYNYGRAYVLFGGRDGGRIAAADMGSAGFVITGMPNGFGESSVAGVGDVNGDGLHDIAVSGPGMGYNNRGASGSAYVVFGKRDTRPVDLRLFDDDGSQGDAGYRIDGPTGGAMLSWDLDGLGDANGDGLADMVIGAPGIGSTYVVYGKADTQPQDLAGLDAQIDLRLANSAGYRIDHWESTLSPYAVAGVGDVNGDGRPDVTIATREDVSLPGRAWVVFGPRPWGGLGAGRIDVAADDFAGFAVKAPDETYDLGEDAGGAGDFNGDGLNDIVLTAPGRLPTNADSDRDSHVYVIYGKTTTSNVRVADLGRRGVEFLGYKPGFGSADGVGDLNGDGYADIATGNGAAFRGAGVVYVVYGCDCRGDLLPLRRLGERSLAIKGHVAQVEGEHLGDGLHSVTGMGDQDGDRRPDLLIGASTRRGGRAFIVPARNLK
jgi:hypothetical protein